MFPQSRTARLVVEIRDNSEYSYLEFETSFNQIILDKMYDMLKASACSIVEFICKHKRRSFDIIYVSYCSDPVDFGGIMGPVIVYFTL